MQPALKRTVSAAEYDPHPLPTLDSISELELEHYSGRRAASNNGSGGNERVDLCTNSAARGINVQQNSKRRLWLWCACSGPAHTSQLVCELILTTCTLVGCITSYAHSTFCRKQYAPMHRCVQSYDNACFAPKWAIPDSEKPSGHPPATFMPSPMAAPPRRQRKEEGRCWSPSPWLLRVHKSSDCDCDDGG